MADLPGLISEYSKHADDCAKDLPKRLGSKEKEVNFTVLLGQLEAAHSKEVLALQDEVSRLGTLLETRKSRVLEKKRSSARLSEITDDGTTPNQEVRLDESGIKSSTSDNSTKPHFEQANGASPPTPSGDAPSVKLEVEDEEENPLLVMVRIVSAKGLRRADWGPGKYSDPYCVCEIDGKPDSRFKTRSIQVTSKPVWNHESVFADWQPGENLVFRVMDEDFGMEGDLLGTCKLSSEQFYPGCFEGNVPLTDAGKGDASLQLNVMVTRRKKLVELAEVWARVPERTNSLLEKSSKKLKKSHSSIGDEQQRPSGYALLKARLMSIARTARRDGFVLHPESGLRMTWDIIGVVVLAFDLIWIPIQFCFSPPPVLWTRIVGWISLMYWTLDVLATFNTGVYTKRGKLINTRVGIAAVYLKGWFILDVMIVGFEWSGILQEWLGQKKSNASAAAGAGRAGRLARIGRAIRVLRLMRLAKLRRILHTIQSTIDSEWWTIVFTVARNLLLILSINHILACLWFLISKNTNGWLIGSQYESMPYGEQYLVSIHWSLSQFTPGASPIQPKSIAERLVAVSVLALGLVMATCFMSSITSTLSAVWAMGHYKNTQALLLKKYLHQQCISRELQTRITRYIDCILELRHKKVHPSKVHYLAFLSGPLAQEMQRQVHEPLLLLYAAFIAMKESCPSAVVSICGQALSEHIFGKTDAIFKRGTPCTDMIFISNGAMVYRFKRFGKDHQLAKMEAGQWCCDHPLWIEWTHVGSMKGLSQAEVTKLRVAVFHQIVGGLSAHDYQIARLFAMNNLERIQQMQSFDVSAVTDLPIISSQEIVRETEEGDLYQSDLNEAEDADIMLIEFSDAEEDDLEDDHDDESDSKTEPSITSPKSSMSPDPPPRISAFPNMPRLPKQFAKTW
jgi:hypothetical protein